ncbi:two-component response regulator 24-like [Juglans microcarpa x Juglans regia]|nr:two-component response regulator 24-like [Juglans microcarpa x Juglans regia]
MESGLLDAYGVEVEAVGTGEAAVELIASGETFDLIVIEMFLPFMSGPETARTIREMGITSKILGIAPMYWEKDAQEFLAAGIDEFLEKPFTPELFVPFLREIDNQK